MGCPLNLSAFLGKVTGLLQIVSPTWSQIAELHVELQSAPSSNDEVAHCARTLTTVLPNISKLYVNAETEDSLCQVVATYLVSAYAGQLVQSECFVTIEPQDVHFSAQLRNLVARCGSKMQSTMVDPASLTHLYIAGNVQHSIQQLFFDSGPASCVELANLEQLCVLSPSDSSDCSSLFKQLAFPNLSVLRINPSQLVCQLIEHARLPDQLTKLEILTMHTGTITMYNVQLASEQRAQLARFIDDEDRVDFWAMTNYLFGAPLSSHSVLTLGRLTRMPAIEHLRWSCLTKLEIMCAVQASFLLQLVPCLPCTQELVVHCLEFDKPELWPSVEPTNACLEVLRLNYPVSDASHLHIMALLVRLLPGLPEIFELFLPVFPPQFFSFVTEYGTKYPHIAGFAV
ncbi:hypothetical protein LPJ63_004935 [Coemansia sp. RSA 2711]|nr:hypothetical protein LPJ63_004935 [Coemansia sp. RSA 2711]